MNSSSSLDRVLGDFKTQLLRWNHQINLVSRKETNKRIDCLLEQSLLGADLIVEYLNSLQRLDTENTKVPINYFDLGSGGGIPGVVWHAKLAGEGFGPATELVEPRAKRSWFLDRLNSIPELSPFSVQCGRWGEEPEHGARCQPVLDFDDAQLVSGGDPASGVTLISLKALKLTDFDVLAGLSASGPCALLGPVLIARYYPPGKGAPVEVPDDLGISIPGSKVAFSGVEYSSVKSWSKELVGHDGPCASLVFSEYLATGA